MHKTSIGETLVSCLEFQWKWGQKIGVHFFKEIIGQRSSFFTHYKMILLH
jgi:hypothetical protein